MSDRLASALGASTCNRTPDQSAFDATTVNTWSAFRYRRGSAESVGQSHLVFKIDRCIRALGKNEIIPTRHSAAVIHPQFIQRKMNTRGTKTSRERGTHLCERDTSSLHSTWPALSHAAFSIRQPPTPGQSQRMSALRIAFRRLISGSASPGMIQPGGGGHKGAFSDSHIGSSAIVG
jgi:hypothetical protein